MKPFCLNSHPFTDLADYRSRTESERPWPDLYSLLADCKDCGSSLAFPDPDCDAEVDAAFAELVGPIRVAAEVVG